MGRTVSPSVIAEQRFLIEDLAHSNQEYIRNFENLRLGNRGDVEGFGDLPTTRRSVQSVFSANDPLFRFDTHRDDSFAGSSDKWPSADISSSKFNDCTKEAPTFGERGAKAKGSAKNTTNSIGQSTDAPIVGYVKPHQKDSSREKGADVPFQPRTSAASVDFYSGFDSLEAGVDVRTPTNYVNFYSGQLMQFNREATACHPISISAIWISEIWIYLTILISNSTWQMVIMILMSGGSWATNLWTRSRVKANKMYCNRRIRS